MRGRLMLHIPMHDEFNIQKFTDCNFMSLIKPGDAALASAHTDTLNRCVLPRKEKLITAITCMSITKIQYFMHMHRG